MSGGNIILGKWISNINIYLLCHFWLIKVEKTNSPVYCGQFDVRTSKCDIKTYSFDNLDSF